MSLTLTENEEKQELKMTHISLVPFTLHTRIYPIAPFTMFIFPIRIINFTQCVSMKTVRDLFSAHIFLIFLVFFSSVSFIEPSLSFLAPFHILQIIASLIFFVLTLVKVV